MEKNVDTIAAVATPSGRGGVGIVRLSGPLTREIAEKMLHFKPVPRQAHYTCFFDADTVIDLGIALFFEGPHSLTGEDVLELQGHGGSVLIQLLLKAVLSCGARLATPGEFLQRAFLNDKLDLAQVEAVADLIDSMSEKAAQSAMRSLQGEFSRIIHQLVDNIVEARMYVESAIDFASEEIDFLKDDQVSKKISALLKTLEKIQKQAKQGALLQSGITLVIAGKPNAGKSSLLNALSQKESAIVTDIPGTTRDIIKEQILLEGVPVHIVDTAGIRDSGDIVEQEGVRRARQAIQQADRILLIVDASTTPENTQQVLEEWTHELPWREKITLVRNKIDLTGESSQVVEQADFTTVHLSTRDPTSVELLKEHLKKVVGIHNQEEDVFTARTRHIKALEAARDHIEQGLEQLEQHGAGELLAEELKLAQKNLNEITGEFTADDLLGKIFSSFCIGK